jgi:hypothetical protein
VSNHVNPNAFSNSCLSRPVFNSVHLVCRQLIDEINDYDAKNANSSNVNDWKKTGLEKSMQIFGAFVKSLERTNLRKKDFSERKFHLKEAALVDDTMELYFYFMFLSAMDVEDLTY